MTGATTARKGDHQMLPQTSSIIAQQKEQGRLASFRRWAARSAKLAGAAAIITLLASPQTFANAAEGSSRIAKERHACAVVLGLDPSDRRYDRCIRGLNRSLAEWDQAQVVRIDRRASSDKGLEPARRLSQSVWSTRNSRQQIPAVMGPSSRPGEAKSTKPDRPLSNRRQQCHASS